jgi:hypothetical protein
MTVRYLLVTAPDDARMTLWAASSLYANWIEGRPNRHGSETWYVTLADGTQRRPVGLGDAFLAVAAKLGATVEEIEDRPDTWDESYRLLVGAAGTGWAEP